MKIIETQRLILRTWEEKDVEPFFNFNQDPKVIEFLCGSLTLEQVKEFFLAVNRHQDKYGYTLWAVELKETNEFIGYIGLNYIDSIYPFAPAVEIGWRLGSQYWGQGYATEGAKASLDFGFNQCGLTEIVSFTALVNLRSINVMEKIGMERDIRRDFAHPKLPPNHLLSNHVFYTLQKKMPS